MEFGSDYLTVISLVMRQEGVGIGWDYFTIFTLVKRLEGVGPGWDYFTVGTGNQSLCSVAGRQRKGEERLRMHTTT